ncbi:MAG: hypothetical protein GY801_38720 [bacterium]|nr:hypothetical protein [bacterium]
MSQFKHRTGNVSGRITDRDNGQPLFGVNIAVADTDIQAKTDLRGRFFIPRLPAGECTLQCSLPGYKTLPDLKVRVMPGETVPQECRLVCKQRISLNEPVVLLPLRLEIRKLVPHTAQTVSVANYTLDTQNVSASPSENFRPFKTKSEVQQHAFQKSEYWIRWFPDDIHYLTPVGKITAAEKTAWDEFYKIYQKQKNAGSVKGLYAQEPYKLTIETLEIFYRLRPGRLTDDEIVRCTAYDEAARGLIQNEGRGLREALGWQDTKNPEIKAAWIAFAKQFGPARARQIAENMLEGNWDFDNENESEEEPLDILMNRGMPLPTLPEEISLYTIKDRKVERLVENIAINRDDLLIAPMDLAGSHWMTDFKQAVEEGMGIIISEPGEVRQIDRADWLIVVGVNTTADSRTVLEEILRRNSAAGEAAILAQDSPTNNTEAVPTQYTELEADAEAYLGKTRMKISEESSPADPAADISNNTPDAHRLTHILKLANSTMSEMAGANLTEMTEATAMAALLWTPCTWFYRQLWGGFFNRDFPEMSRFLEQLKPGNFFVDHVRARGTLPVIRIGENPYGILPVISLPDWCKNLARNAKVSARDAEKICDLIVRLKNSFLDLSQDLPKVDLASDEEKYETLLEILRSAPIAKRIEVRAFNAETPTDLSADPKYLDCLPVKDKAETKEARVDTPYPETAYLCDFSHVNRDDFNPACFRIDKDSPLLKRILNYFLEMVFGEANEPANCEMSGIVVDKKTGAALPGATVSLGGTDMTATTDEKGQFVLADVPAGEHSLQVNLGDYHVAKSTHVAFRPFAANKVNFGLSPVGKPRGNIDDKRQPIRESGQKSAGTIKGRVADRRSGKAVSGAIVHLAGTGKSVTTDTDGKYTFAAVPAGDHQVTVSTGGYDTASFSAAVSDAAPAVEVNTGLSPLVISPGGPVPQGPEIPGGLNLLAEAAGLLKKVDPDKLETLLMETLDLFSHRLDAWFTGLANSVLEECQRENTQPPPVGVYGWLEKPGKLDFKSVEPEFIQAPSVKQATTAAILRNASMHNGTPDDSGAFQINLSSEQIRKGVWYLEGLRQGHLPGELLGYRLERMIHEESRKSKSPIKETDIFDLRDQYPLILQETRDETDESTATLTIIDGEKFLQDEETDSKFKEKFKEIKGRLNRIKDAAADIAMCEVIDAHDNVARRGGWLDFLDGDSLPPREEFIRSHRTGDVHGTKVLLPIMPPEQLEADASETNPRIIADPILAHFCETLMPDFESKEIVACLTDIESCSIRQITFLVRELNIHPIDFVIGGLEEIKIRIRYYLLSCWKENDPTDTTSASPCNILGPFPDFDQSDELLNEVGIDLVPPAGSEDTLSIFNCIDKAKLIRNLIHQNRARNSPGTVHPQDIPLVNQEQLDQLDPLAGFELLAKRLRRIRDQLIRLIATTVEATGELKRRHLILQGLRQCPRCVQKIRDALTSEGNDSFVDDIIEQLKAKVNNLIDSDPDFRNLAGTAQILAQIDQIANGDNNISEVIENLRSQISDLEKQFGVYIENTAKALVTSANLPLLEISRFGLEKALTIFPQEPTVAASVKIIKLFDQIIASLIEKLQPLISDSPELQNYVHCLKVVYLNAGELNEILNLHHDDEAATDEQLRNRLPLTGVQSQIIITEPFQTANYFEPLLNSFLDNMNSLAQSPTYYEDYRVGARLSLIDDPAGVYNIIKNPEMNILETLINTCQVTERQAEIMAGFKFEDIAEFDLASIQASIVSTTNGKIAEIISLLQAATDKEGMVILTPYFLTRENGQRSDWTLDFSQLAALTGPTYLQEYQKVRPTIDNLFELFDVGGEIRVFEDKRYQRLDPEAEPFKKPGNTNYLYLTPAIDSLLPVKCLTFLLIDQWQEGIPNPEQSETTGVTLRYESPQAEAPNAIIIAVPPYKSSSEYWGTDLLANTLLETIELMQIRLVGSNEVISDRPLILRFPIPALLFPPAKDGKPLFPSREELFRVPGIGTISEHTLASMIMKNK